MAIAEGRDDDRFDFSDLILGERKMHNSSQIKHEASKVELSSEAEVQTSYLLVNALLNLLIKKGIIHSYEVQDIVSELHRDYLKKKGSRGNGTG
ncbi:hypothetical protein [Bacillus atrophaeus]|uniref:hypothetical protein n=1 Tax=Bacillus atrophaeus TaxID=1452 RepID=UPI001C101567|nr:hypothetical protein [Bacillus atrophaeus]MBU5262052.1 hypothetical protein [Bacillus atrophaeus]MCY8466488.1 hypothetical protein [Bacillus atrophaeus]MCY8478947.1 hypothetical protein [Bacillus atrophaeus]